VANVNLDEGLEEAELSERTAGVIGRVSTIGTFAVIAAAFWSSAESQYKIALNWAGKDPIAAAMLPVALDAAIIVAVMSLTRYKSAGRRQRLPWFVIVFGTLFSSVLNWVHVVLNAAPGAPQPEVFTGAAVSSIMPLMIGLATHLQIEGFFLDAAIRAKRLAKSVAADRTVLPPAAPVKRDAEPRPVLSQQSVDNLDGVAL